MSKRLLSLLSVGIISTFILSGCGNVLVDSIDKTLESTIKETLEDSVIAKEPEEKTYSNKEFTVSNVDKHTSVMIHKETNVQYLKVVRNAGVDGGVAVVPLYQTNGKPYVGNEINPNRFVMKLVDKHTTIITDKETNVQYMKVMRNAGFDGGVSLTPLINREGGLLIAEEE